MPAPSNNDFTTAISLGTLPADVTQTNVNDGVQNYNVYYKFTAPVGSNMISAWGFSGNIGSGYRPIIRSYIGPASSPTQILGIAATNVPIQFPVIPGVEYFLEFARNITSQNSPTNQVRIRVSTLPLNVAVEGDIVVNDDTNEFPAVVLSSTVNYTTKKFYHNIAASDDGDVLHSADQILLVGSDIFGNYEFRRYDRNFNVLQVYTRLDDNAQRVSGNSITNKWYIGASGSGITEHPKFATISAAGVMSAPVTLDLSSSGLLALAGNNDDTILYWVGLGGIGSPVKRWDIVNGIALTDLASGIANYFSENIIVLEDNTILVSFSQFSGGNEFYVNRYSPTGTLLNTYNFGTDIGGITPKIARAVDSPNSFWVWIQHPVGIERIGTFRNVKVSDGSTISSVNHASYTGGAYDGGETTTPTALSGFSSSCIFLILGPPGGGGGGGSEPHISQLAMETISLPPDMSGIYFINPIKLTKHDSYYNNNERRIPNPTVRTAYLGE